MKLDLTGIDFEKLAESRLARKTRSSDEVAELIGPWPNVWRCIEKSDDGLVFERLDFLKVIVTALVEDDEREWLHVSMSRSDRMPDYDDVAAVKTTFIGEQRKAVMIFPRRDEHINIHSQCLHLWACLDGDPLPDFTHGTGSI